MFYYLYKIAFSVFRKFKFAVWKMAMNEIKVSRSRNKVVELQILPRHERANICFEGHIYLLQNNTVQQDSSDLVTEIKRG